MGIAWRLGAGVLAVLAICYIFLSPADTLFAFAGGALLVVFLADYRIGALLAALLVPVSQFFVGLEILDDAPWLSSDILTRTDRLSPLCIATLLMIPGYLLWKINHARGRRALKTSLWMPFLLLICYAAISLSWVRNAGHGYVHLLFLFCSCMLFGLIFHAIEEEAMFRKFCAALMLSGVAHACIVAYLYTLPVQSPYIFFQKVIFGDMTFTASASTGLLVDGVLRRGCALTFPYETGLFFSYLSVVAFGWFLFAKKRPLKFVLLFLVFLFFTVVFSTKSRGPVLCMGVMFAVCLLVNGLARRKTIRYGVLLLALVAAGFLTQSVILNAAAGKEVAERLLTTKVYTKTAPTTRAGLWRKSFREVGRSENPGLGVGGSYLVDNVHAHSLYFSLYFEYSFIGVAFIIAIFAMYFKSLIISLRYQSTFREHMNVAFFSGFIGMCVYLSFDFDYNTPVFWFFFATSMACSEAVKRERNLSWWDGRPLSKIAVPGCRLSRKSPRHGEAVGAPG